MSRKKKRKGSGFFSNLLLLLCIVVFCVAAWKLWGYYNNYHGGRKEYEQLRQYVKEKKDSDKKKKKKSGADTCPVQVDFDALARINPDVKAWIYIKGTGINYPIVQTTDNTSYLHRTFEGKDSFIGAIFLDAGCEADFSSENSIVYGHNLKNGQMFGMLKKHYDTSYNALRDLNAIIRDDMMKKEYLTITVGAPPQGRFVAWLQHSEKNNKVRIHARDSEGYKQIITEVTVIRQAGPFALCRIGLITGRTHQIRAHLAYLGHPVLGDIKYGNHKMNERTGLKTQALCAQRLTFGRIPEENTLQYLSGRVIKLNDPEIVKTYERLTAEK